ncbi:MAG: large subunit ribosomal protein L22 [Alphaproteobacteria bacterium]|jgi:large subunit ribosomal protein L22
MAKAKQSRRLADNETQAFLKSCKSSAQKARLVLDMIRGKSVDAALADLTFSKKAISVEIKKLLESAIANAENNHDLNVDNLYIKATMADKSFQMKRWRCRARGRMGKILKPRCHLTIVVAEKVKVEPKTNKEAA